MIYCFVSPTWELMDKYIHFPQLHCFSMEFGCSFIWKSYPRKNILSSVTLQSVLHSAARLILRIRKYDHISTAIREELHWLPVHHRIQFKTCALVHKCLHGLAPSYLIDMIGSVSKEPGRRHLRSAAHGDLVVPASRTKTLGPRAFAISGPHSWNNIPVALRDSALSFHEFCVKLKTELYRQINWNWTISAFVTVSTVRSFFCALNKYCILTYLLTCL